MNEKEAKVKSLAKALKILELFDRDHPERGVMELARLSGMMKSSVYNIISTFYSCGYLEKSDNGRYRLGLKILELSNVLQNNQETPKLVKPFMDKIAEECNETVYFAIPSATEVIYMEASHPRGMTFTRSVVGVKVKMYCTSVGKAMLAFSGEELFRAVVDAGMPAFTPFTLTNEQALREDLEQTRRRGYAIDNMEHEYGIRCIGVPVRNARGDIVGALSISGPSLRVMDDKVTLFSASLLNASNELQSLLK